MTTDPEQINARLAVVEQAMVAFQTAILTMRDVIEAQAAALRAFPLAIVTKSMGTERVILRNEAGEVTGLLHTCEDGTPELRLAGPGGSLLTLRPAPAEAQSPS